MKFILVLLENIFFAWGVAISVTILAMCRAKEMVTGKGIKSKPFVRRHLLKSNKQMQG